MNTSVLAKWRAELRKVVCPLHEIRLHVPMESSVFDLGCGTGAILVDLIQTRRLRRVGGSETSSSLLAVARAAALQALGNSASLEDFVHSKAPPLCLGSYDCLLFIDVLHHIPRAEQPRYLRQLGQTMRPGARLILKDINAARVSVLGNRLHDALFAGNGFQEISLTRALDLVISAGLKIIGSYEIQRLWYPHYFVIAQKN